MNFRTLDLNLLRVLDALLRERSVTRAAARLGLSQPAVSAALGRLRTATGDRLLLRRGREMELTAHARAVAPELADALARIESALDATGTFDPFTSNAVMRLSASDYFADLLMPALAARLAAEAPGVRLQLVDLAPPGQLGALERNTADLALVPGTGFPGWAAHRPTLVSDFAVVARGGHPDLSRAGIPPGTAIPLDLYCALGHVAFSPEGRLETRGDAALAALGRGRRVAVTLPVFSGIGRVVAETDYLALMPRGIAESLATILALDVYDAPMPVLPATISMVWPRHLDAVPAQRWFRDLVAGALGSLPGGVPAH